MLEPKEEVERFWPEIRRWSDRWGKHVTAVMLPCWYGTFVRFTDYRSERERRGRAEDVLRRLVGGLEEEVAILESIDLTDYGEGLLDACQRTLSTLTTATHEGEG